MERRKMRRRMTKEICLNMTWMDGVMMTMVMMVMMTMMTTKTRNPRTNGDPGPGPHPGLPDLPAQATLGQGHPLATEAGEGHTGEALQDLGRGNIGRVKDHKGQYHQFCHPESSCGTTCCLVSRINLLFISRNV